jgi:hypothetical protein
MGDGAITPPWRPVTIDARRLPSEIALKLAGTVRLGELQGRIPRATSHPQ